MKIVNSLVSVLSFFVLVYLTSAKLCGQNEFVIRFEEDYIQKFENQDIRALWDKYKQSQPVSVKDKLDYGQCSDIFATQTMTCCPADFIKQFKTLLKAYWNNQADNKLKKPVCNYVLKQLGKKINTCGLQSGVTSLPEDLTASVPSTTPSNTNTTAVPSSATTSETVPSTTSNTTNSSTPSTTTNSSAASNVTNSTTVPTSSNTTNTTNTTSTNSSTTVPSDTPTSTASSANSNSVNNVFYTIFMKNNVAQGLLVKETMNYLRGIMCLLCQDPSANATDKQKLFKNGKLVVNQDSLTQLADGRQSALTLLQSNHMECLQKVTKTLNDNLNSEKCPKLLSSVASIFQNKDPCPQNDNCTTAAGETSKAFQSPIDDLVLVTEEEITTLGAKRRRFLANDTNDTNATTPSPLASSIEISTTGGLSAYIPPKDQTETSDLTLDGVAFDPIISMATTLVSSNETAETTTAPKYGSNVILDSLGQPISLESQIFTNVGVAFLILLNMIF